MGGKALAKYGIETERKSTEDFYRIGEYMQTVLKEHFNAETYITKFFHEKETHGDLDLLIKVDGSFNITKDWVNEVLKPRAINSNNGVWSFDYENFQVDFIFVSQKNWETSKFFFDYSPIGNLMGKTAKVFDLKYGFEGLIYPFRNFSGRLVKDIVISKDIPKIFEFLGYDYNQYQNGFNNLMEIFHWVIDSKFFNADKFQMENLTGVDRKRNRKRGDYQQFLEYINENNFPNKYDGGKLSMAYVESYFPESNFTAIVSELAKKDQELKAIAEKFNGRLIMEQHPELKGKELGDAMNNFKSKFENWNEYVLENSSEFILEEFNKMIND